MGTVGVLNVGAGHIKLTFDKNDPAECVRAARIVKDMLKRGYALLVETEPGKYRRAVDFVEETYEYVIADFDRIDDETTSHEKGLTPDGSPEKKARGRKKRVSATETSAVAVGRTAGG